MTVTTTDELPKIFDTAKAGRTVALPVEYFMHTETLPAFLGSVDIEASLRYLENVGSYQLSLLCKVLSGSEPLYELVTFKAPASWWQHFKQDRLPEWYKKRWPVRYKYDNRECRQTIKICPHYSDKVSFGPHIRFLTSPVIEEEQTA